jgi:hypothetical protein
MSDIPIPAEGRLRSMVCKRADWDMAWFTRWAGYFTSATPAGAAYHGPVPKYHRKIWEWCVITQALSEAGMLAPGKQGCGFAVGREPLASLFASLGSTVLATDIAADDASALAWSSTGQHAPSLDALYCPDIIDRATFDTRVRFKPQDMRDLSPDQLGTFDFIWSSCSLEHLGSLEEGWQYVLRSTELLRPGGIAVHTTEFNISSENNTLFDGGSVIYRLKDISNLGHRLRLIGCGIEPFDDFPGVHQDDLEYDYMPYYENGRQHIKLLLGGFVTTSCLIIIRKSSYPSDLRKLNDGAPHAEAIQASAPGSKIRPPSIFLTLRGSQFWRVTAPLRAPLRWLLRSVR